MWRFPSFESLVQDTRYAIRSLVRAPGFSVVAILVLAIGIGANTAMFSLVDAMLLRGLPYADADRLVVLFGTFQRTTAERRGNSFPDHRDWRTLSTQFEDLAAYWNTTITLEGLDEPERIQVETVSAPYFSLLRVAPMYGRTFREDEDAVPNRDRVAVLSDGLWRRRFGSDPNIVNRTIQLGGQTYTVIGVMPPGFTGVSDTAQLWVPFMMNSNFQLENRSHRGFLTLARLKTGATIQQAQAELDGISAQLATAYRLTNENRGVAVDPLSRQVFGPLESIVLTLMAAVSFVLLIACTNVANLLIGRSETRQKEIAVRTALGAGPARLFRQLVTESCVLTLTGAATGAALASLTVNAVVALSPIKFPSFVQPGLNPAVLAFTGGIAIVGGILLGLAPAMHSRPTRLPDALKESARGGSGGIRSQRLRSALVIAEVAMAIVLCIGAGLMIRSGQKRVAVDPGFDTEGLLVIRASIPTASTPQATAPVAGQPLTSTTYVLSGRELLERVRAVPGVVSASLSSDVPLDVGSAAIVYQAEGDTTTDAQNVPRAFWHRVSSTFFETMRIPVTAGRTFTDADATPTGSVVIVSDNLAKRFWPNQNPIGKRIKPNGQLQPTNPWLEIVGTVAETKYRGLPNNPTPDPDIYLPALDRSPQPLLIRTAIDPTAVAPAVRAAIRQNQPTIALYGETTMTALVDGQTSASRFTTWILGLFAAAALMLSIIGIYGVMAYLVTQRTSEFGIRLALGATRADVVTSVLRQGAILIALGTVIGIAVTGGLYRVFSSQLFEVTALDISSALAILSLVAAAVLACLVPAIRATRVDPVTALRN
jgi:predicted permease